MNGMKRGWVFVLLGILLLGWVGSLFLEKRPEPEVMPSLIDVEEPVLVGEAESVVEEEALVMDVVEVAAVDDALVEVGEETRGDLVEGGDAKGALGGGMLEGVQGEPEDVETYAVITGWIVFGLATEESRLSSSSGGLSEESRDRLVESWKESDVSMVPLDPIALRRPDWAVMDITWNSVDGSDVRVSSKHVDRPPGVWESQAFIDSLLVGTSGVRLRFWMKEGSRKYDVDSTTWTNGAHDSMGDLGSMKVSEDGAATHYQFHWSGEDYSVVMSVEERSREALEAEEGT